MADRVPYTGVPEAVGAQAPRFEPTPEFHVEAPAAAFGTNIGQAVQGLGEVQEGAGKEMFQRAMAFQDLTNHATARGASVKTAQEQAQLWADFDSKGGMDAGPEALKKLQQDLDSVRVRNGSGLNPMANEYYQNDAASTQSRLFIYSASHSAQALKQADKDSITAQRLTANGIAEATAHRGDTDVSQAYAHNHSAVVLEGHHDGYAPDSDIAKQKLIQYNSETSLGVVRGFADRQQPAEAKAFLDNAEKKGLISGQWADQAHKIVESSQVDYQSKDIVNKTHDPKLSEADNIKNVTDAANKARMDARGVDATIAQERTKYAVDKSIQTQQLDRANSKIDQAILARKGEAPVTYQELRLDPDLSEAWKTIDENQEKAGQTALDISHRTETTAKNDNDLTDERRLVARHLYGEARDPSQVSNFINEDLWHANITMDQRKELLKLQDGIRASGSSLEYRDHAVEQAIAHKRTTLRDDLGWAQGSTEETDFRGHLEDEFNYLREQGKVIDPKMADDIATKLLQDKLLSPGVGGSNREILGAKWGRGMEPNVDEAARIRKRWGANLSDDDVQKLYLKGLADTLYNQGQTNAPR